MTNEFLNVLKSSGADDYIHNFLKEHESLKEIYASKRDRRNQPVLINGRMLSFSPGKHNLLQKAVVENFKEQFAPNSRCLYVGDTTEKDLIKDIDALKNLGFEITLHDKMPDVVLFDESRNWLYFVEAVTSVGPMDPKRIVELTALTKNVCSGKIFVTAFLDFKKEVFCRSCVGYGGLDCRNARAYDSFKRRSFFRSEIRAQRKTNLCFFFGRT